MIAWAEGPYADLSGPDDDSNVAGRTQTARSRLPLQVRA